MVHPDLRSTVAYLRSPTAIRERCGQLFQLACHDQLAYFRCDLSQLAPTATYVIQVMQDRYPHSTIPFHSRWRHFEVGGVPRLQYFDLAFKNRSDLERARSKLDLVIVSVLLDAGAGSAWSYREPGTDQIYSRSEGLAVASFHMIQQGLFSSDPADPLRVDAVGLQRLTLADLAAAFQVQDRNPLVGLEGRLALLHQLGVVIAQDPDRFGTDPPRPGHLADFLLQLGPSLPAPLILTTILESLGEIWPGRIHCAGINLGDVWPHSALGSLTSESASLSHTWVPFHKLSQWLTYSLLEPLQELGITITDLDALTGLAEYRNGGLCLDLGLLQLKDPTLQEQPHSPASEIIVEWRALTVCLLDHLADQIRTQLGQSAQDLPLVKILQGGTWTAGRQIALDRRAHGSPPLQIMSDGTVF